jgi:NADH dehydrogenase FAD-containing subunit
MRSVSHPQVYAAGDSVRALDDGTGRPLPMSCATAGFTRMRATASIIEDLTGRSASTRALTYFGNCISLGQRDAIFQPVDGDAESRSWSLRGRPASGVKNGVLKGTAWNMDNPTYGLPSRRRRLTHGSDRSTEVIDA